MYDDSLFLGESVDKNNDIKFNDNFNCLITGHMGVGKTVFVSDLFFQAVQKGYSIFYPIGYARSETPMLIEKAITSFDCRGSDLVFIDMEFDNHCFKSKYAPIFPFSYIHGDFLHFINNNKIIIPLIGSGIDLFDTSSCFDKTCKPLVQSLKQKMATHSSYVNNYVNHVNIIDEQQVSFNLVNMLSYLPVVYNNLKLKNIFSIQTGPISHDFNKNNFELYPAFPENTCHAHFSNVDFAKNNTFSYKYNLYERFSSFPVRKTISEDVLNFKAKIERV